MKKILLLNCTLLSFLTGFTQATAATVYANSITGAGLKKHLTIIAGEDFEGRETGTEGQRKAAVYIESQFKALGLKPAAALKGYQQFYPLYQDSLQETLLSINGKPAEFGKDFVAPLNLNETGKFKGKKIVFAGYGIDDSLYTDYKGIDVKGKVVIIFLGEPKKNGKYFISGTNRSSDWTYPGLPLKIRAAAKKGAVGVVVVNPNQETFNKRVVDNGKKTGVYFPQDKDDTKGVNAVQLSHAFAKEIIGNNFDTLTKMARSGMPIEKKWAMELKTRSDFSFIKYHSVINASNVDPVEAIKEMTASHIDADLGGDVYKKRVPLPGRGKRAVRESWLRRSSRAIGSCCTASGRMSRPTSTIGSWPRCRNWLRCCSRWPPSR